MEVVALSDDGGRHLLPSEQAPSDWTWVIELTQGYVALVDEGDIEVLSRYRWKILKASGKLYACRSRKLPGKKHVTLLMHRAILDAPKGLNVDHRNGNGLDNRRCNLRLATDAENQRNRGVAFGTSRFKGVHWNKPRKIWHSQIANGEICGGNHHIRFLGYYEKEEDAALAYDRKAIELFGEFACLNLPGQDDGRELIRSNRPQVVKRGEDQGGSKLKEHQVIEIKKRILNGDVLVRISEEFGVSTALIWAIKSGRIWKHVEIKESA